MWWRCTVLPSLPWVVCFLSFFLFPRNEGWRPKGQRAKGQDRQWPPTYVSSLTLPFTASLTTSPNASREKQNRTAYETGRSGSDSESTLKKSLARSAHRSQTTPKRGSGENTSTERLTSETETQGALEELPEILPQDTRSPRHDRQTRKSHHLQSRQR